MAVTETIQELLQGIDDAQYGRDMRQYIHKGIQKCYEEGSAGETDLTARQAIADLLGNFATVETSSTASRAYEVGENLVYDNVMYKVITAIAQGGTITPGTNVQATTVAAACDAAVEAATDYTLDPAIKSSLELNSQFIRYGFGDNNSVYYKTGSTVVVRLDFSFMGDHGEIYDPVFTLPAGSRPNEETAFSVVTQSADTFYIKIKTDGGVWIEAIAGGTASGTKMYVKGELRFDLFESA